MISCFQAAEWESIEMQMKHEKKQKDKEMLLNCLVEAESVCFYDSMTVIQTLVKY